MFKKASPNQSLKLHRLIAMVVDDDEMIRKLIIEHLRAMGFKNFIEASDGTEAYKYLVDPAQRIDLIICDWEMPRTDGLTFLRAVRSSRHRGHSNVPFIFVTSQQSEERVKISKAKQHHVNAYIVKPFRAETLRDKVIEVLIETMEKKTLVS